MALTASASSGVTTRWSSRQPDILTVTRMMDLQTWHEANGQFLSAALRWLRARLEQCARRGADAGHQSKVKANSHKWSDAEQERLAAEAMHEAARLDPPPALIVLAGRLGLSRFEQDLLLLCTAMELDTRVPALCAVGPPGRPQAVPDVRSGDDGLRRAGVGGVVTATSTALLETPRDCVRPVASR